MTQPPTPPSPPPTAALRTRFDGWTPDRQRRFVEVLAVVRCVTTAAALVGMSARSAYKLRNHAGAVEFRAAWDAALFQPFAEVGPTLAEQAAARETIVRPGRGPGGSVTITRPLSPAKLIALLERREAAVARTQKRAFTSPS